MSACSRARDADKALRLLKTIESDYGVTPNAVVYSSAISACSRAKPAARWKTALQLIHQAEQQHSVKINNVGYNAALSACARAEPPQIDAAVHLFQTMIHKEKEQQKDNSNNNDKRHTLVDAISYGTILAACERAQRWDLLLQYGDKMRNEAGFAMDTLATTSVLHACQQLGLADQAVRYLQFMKSSACSPMKARNTAGWKRQGVKTPLQGPDAVAYRLAISACARGRDWEKGIQLLHEMKETCLPDGADVTAYTSAIAGCEYAGEWRKAFGLVDMMRKDGVQPNQVTMAAVMGACATACAKQDDEQKDHPAYKKALQLLRVMKKDDSVVDPNIIVYNAAIRTCAEASELDMAFQLLDDALEYGLEPTLFTYGSLMLACERVGSMDGVNKVFGMMRDANVEPNEVIFGAAISCSRKTGKPDRALLLLRKMIKNNLHPNLATFNTVLVSQTDGRKANLRGALLVYQLMLQVSSSGQNPKAKPNRQTYSILIRSFASRKQPEGAEALLRRMQLDGIKPDVDLYTTTVTSYEKQGKPMKALRLMESMEQDGYDFYEVKVLNTAFKNAVKLVNAVGKTLRDGDNMGDDNNNNVDDTGPASILGVGNIDADVNPDDDDLVNFVQTSQIPIIE